MRRACVSERSKFSKVADLDERPRRSGGVGREMPGRGARSPAMAQPPPGHGPTTDGVAGARAQAEICSAKRR